MKRVLGFLVLIAAGSSVVRAQSMLRVSLSDRTPITVSVDGRYFNTRGQSVTVGDLPAGRHMLQVYSTVQGRRRMREEVIYEGYVKTYNGQVTLFTYDYPTQGIDLQEQAMGQPAPPPVNNQGAYDNQGGYGYQNGNSNYNSQPPAAQQSTQAQDNSNWQPSAGPVASPVSDPITTEGKNKLARLKKKVDTKITDTDKMAAVKEGLKTEMINCAQIAVIMDWFNFESTKVEFAEWSYDRVTDKEHFSEVREKLAYNSYRDELDKFLQGKK